MLFRKKPVTVNACEYRAGSPPPEGVTVQIHKSQEFAFIDTDHGQSVVNEGDFIVTGTGGEKYPVSPERFWEIYEVVG